MSWSDPCGNCGQHRADCDCGNWNNYKSIEIPKVKEPVNERIVVAFDTKDKKYCYMHTAWTNEELSFRWSVISEAKDEDNAKLEVCYLNSL